MPQQEEDAVPISSGKRKFPGLTQSLIVLMRSYELAQGGFCGTARIDFFAMNRIEPGDCLSQLVGDAHGLLCPGGMYVGILAAHALPGFPQLGI